MKTEIKKKNPEVGKVCEDKTCPKHGGLKTRGKIFQGGITKIFPRRLVMEFERMVYSRKYERYYKSRTKIHVRLPFCMKGELDIGDQVRIQECRPLSKRIHFVVLNKIEKNKTKK